MALRDTEVQDQITAFWTVVAPQYDSYPAMCLPQEVLSIRRGLEPSRDCFRRHRPMCQSIDFKFSEGRTI
jgi:hypothetical protein